MLALAARVESRSAFVLAASALAIDAVVILLIGGVRRWAVLTYPAITSIVTASYVVLLSVGKGDPAMAYVLGLNAVLQALVLWPIGEVCRRSREKILVLGAIGGDALFPRSLRYKPRTFGERNLVRRTRLHFAPLRRRQERPPRDPAVCAPPKAVSRTLLSATAE